jgi:phenylpropionate dioxygenase-like ring-hydroxylating dioxygenase large terminal subunit
MLRPDAPNAAQLLGTRLVLWRDGGGVWRAHEDVCPHRCELPNLTLKIGVCHCFCYNLHRHVLQHPHKCMFINLCIYHSAAAPVRSASRLAPLSEGRLQDGQLQCTYHGAQAASQPASQPTSQSVRQAACPLS